MRIFALELDNDIKGIEQTGGICRGDYQISPASLFVLPELSRCSYMASREIWKYADENGRSTSEWAVRTARTCFIG